MSSPITYNNFNVNRCNECYQKDPTKCITKTKVICKCCKLIKYCSIEHQAFGWNMHQAFCQALQTITKVFNVDHILLCAEKLLSDIPDSNKNEKRSLKRNIDCTINLLEKVVKRKLLYHERVMLLYPLACNVCMDLKSENLMFCSGCNQIAYCSTKHQEQDKEKHSKWCNAYRINFIMNNRAPDMINISRVPALKHADLSLFPEDCFHLASTILTREIREQRPNGPVMEQLEELENIKIASYFCWVGTGLYVLRTTGMLNELRDNLTVFIVGAHHEMIYFDSTTCAAFFSYIPKLRRIKLIFIGPELSGDCHDLPIVYEDSRQVEFIHYRSLFHELPVDLKLDHPHLILAFNCGFHEVSELSMTWMATIPLLLRFCNVPIAFTSYTYGEAIDDCTFVLREAQEMKMQEQLTFVKRASTNPFSDTKPLRNDDIEDERDELFYENKYLSIAIMKKY